MFGSRYIFYPEQKRLRRAPEAGISDPNERPHARRHGASFFQNQAPETSSESEGVSARRRRRASSAATSSLCLRTRTKRLGAAASPTGFVVVALAGDGARRGGDLRRTKAPAGTAGFSSGRAAVVDGLRRRFFGRSGGGEWLGVRGPLSSRPGISLSTRYLTGRRAAKS